MKILIKAVVSSLLFFSLNAVASQFDPLPVVCGHEMNSQDEATYGVLNYGLYWFGDKETDQGPTSFCAADQNVFFDTTKKHTLIFVHGFSPNSVQNNTRFNFDAHDIAGPNVNDLVAPWLTGASGDRLPWNVGVFYWNQFADEEPDNPLNPFLDIQATQTAEAKIWRTTGPGQMRWRDNHGLEHEQPLEIKQDMAHIFADQYINELKAYAKQNPTADMRLVGESLGSQMVIHGARLIADQVDAAGSGLPQNLIPKQIVVLDPVITKDGLDETRLHTLLKDIKKLKKKGVIFSGYRTSNIGMSAELSDNTKLLKTMAFSDDKPAECIYRGTSQLKNQHTFGIWWYLLSYTLPKVPVLDAPNASAPFANLPASDLKTLMDGSIKFVSNYVSVPGQGECDPAAIDSEWAGWQMKMANKMDPR